MSKTNKAAPKASGTKRKSVTSINRLNQLETQNYANLRSKCQESGTLFEDASFPANSSSFYCNQPKMEFKWLRPSQIKTNPQFCPEFTMPTKLNITQGQIGNFWFLGAVAALTINKDAFEKVVPKDQTFSGPDYKGIFRFRLWYGGKWREIVIDDRLPTVDGQLVMAYEKQLNHFWCSLLEKAYAKLVGCYESLVGSYTSEALEDFTGGLCENYSLKGKDVLSTSFLFSIVFKSILHSSLIVCCAETEDKQNTKQLPNGIWENQFYAVSAVNTIEVDGDVGQIRLIRLRNMSNSIAEWKGSWGPNSSEWKQISPADKSRFGLTLDFEGEFWMSFDDFKAIFSRMDICNLDNQQSCNISNKTFSWAVNLHDGKWEPGVSAGGCSTKGPFHTNPRFILLVNARDCDPEDDNFATVVIGLMQKNRASKKSTGLFDLKIGFQIYSLESLFASANPNQSEPMLALQNFTNEFFQQNKPIAGTKSYINKRQVFGRYRLKPGAYMIVPCTFKANLKGLFLLRIFCERIAINYPRAEQSDSSMASSSSMIDKELSSIPMVEQKMNDPITPPPPQQQQQQPPQQIQVHVIIDQQPTVPDPPKSNDIMPVPTPPPPPPQPQQQSQPPQGILIQNSQLEFDVLPKQMFQQSPPQIEQPMLFPPLPPSQPQQQSQPPQQVYTQQIQPQIPFQPLFPPQPPATYQPELQQTPQPIQIQVQLQFQQQPQPIEPVKLFTNLPDQIKANTTSGYLKYDEIVKCLQQLQIESKYSLPKIIYYRYGCEQDGIGNERPKDRGVDFSNFAVSTLKLRNAINYWDNLSRYEPTDDVDKSGENRKQILRFTLQGFLEQIMMT
ncbi:hypothetical protein RDWZM_004978 [Blomia tropicalis]|uniref:Calpain catalytic domain-containing protein n=1 Tax=Blomia tropicalis TaxID=40697 RepID=A0A9Q0M4Q1_BLOTA|nr:hypothetical protein RDWZM_004978 [Blomia tropicalis]